MNHTEVGVGAEIRLQEFRMCVVLLSELLNITLVCCFRKPTLLIQESKDTHRFLNQVDGGLQVEPEIDKLPVNSLL